MRDEIRERMDDSRRYACFRAKRILSAWREKRLGPREALKNDWWKQWLDHEFNELEKALRKADS